MWKQTPLSLELGSCSWVVITRAIRRISFEITPITGGITPRKTIVVSRVLSRKTIVITPITGLITPLKTAHEPPSSSSLGGCSARVVPARCHADLYASETIEAQASDERIRIIPR